MFCSSIWFPFTIFDVYNSVVVVIRTVYDLIRGFVFRLGQETQCPSPSSVGETSGIPSFNLQPDVTEKVEEDVARNRNISINEAQDFQGYYMNVCLIVIAFLTASS